MATTRPITLKEYLEFIPNSQHFNIGNNEEVWAVGVPTPQNYFVIPYQLVIPHPYLPNCMLLGQPLFITDDPSPAGISNIFNKIAPSLSYLPFDEQLKTTVLNYSIAIKGKIYNAIWMLYIVEHASYEDVRLQLVSAKDVFGRLERHLIKRHHNYLTDGTVILNYANPTAAINYVREVMSQTV